MEKYEFSKEKRELLESMKAPFAIYQFINKKVVTLILSDGFCKEFGYDDRTQAYFDMDHDMYKAAHPDDVARIAEAAIRFATEGGKYEVVYRTMPKDESGYYVVHAIGEHVMTETGVQLAHVWYTNEGRYVEDSSSKTCTIANALSKLLHEQSIIRSSRYDFLTGLPGMTYFFELAEAEKNTILEENGRPVVLFMDFSGMKFYNSKHGFEQGNQVLKFFGRKLIEIFNNENCCRIGADHFTVMTEETGLESKLRRLFYEFGEFNGGQTPPVHVGIYQYRLEDVAISAACDRAKISCNSLRGIYSSCFSYYSAELREETLLRQYIIENIDKAIREKWIQVFYQPIIRSVNEKICDEEALARWIDPVRGFMSPASFIPVLEDSGLIYKLDLYVLEQVLRDMKELEKKNLHLVPHSINLSRVDFDACDIVEEIRRRVDEAGINRDRITIEITESVIGSNFDFMKEQIRRFQDLGFPVWMDDFGSGYSSLDVLQSIRFDLIKFDMSFMKRLDEGENGKIILTELMKMVTAMGIEATCEGVETKEQVTFLREIGCSKLQGFYFEKPNPFSKMINWYLDHHENSIENPKETQYYSEIGRINLYDLDVIAQGEKASIRNAFDTLPMGVIEIKGDSSRFVRSNQSYRDFIYRFFGANMSEFGTGFEKYDSGFMTNVVKMCCEQGQRSFFDETMPDGSIVHSFARRISINHVTGVTAVVIAVLSITDPEDGVNYADIARTLASNYYNIYIVDLDTDQYIEYSSKVGSEQLAMERHGIDFFESAQQEINVRIYEQDRDFFKNWFSKENIIHELDKNGAFITTYRLVDTGTPQFVTMKISRMQSDKNRIILGISVIDTYMKQKERFEQLQKEQELMVRLMALSDGYMSIFTVDPNSGYYIKYSSTSEFESFEVAMEGDDFFGKSVTSVKQYVVKEDQQYVLERLTRENVLNEIKINKKFRLRYRLVLQDVVTPVILKAASFMEDGKEKLVIGLRACPSKEE